MFLRAAAGLGQFPVPVNGASAKVSLTPVTSGPKLRSGPTLRSGSSSESARTGGGGLQILVWNLKYVSGAGSGSGSGFYASVLWVLSSVRSKLCSNLSI